MGFTHAELRIRKTQGSRQEKTLEFLIDSGATYTFVPKDTLKELGIKPLSKRSFFLANGDAIKRDMGVAYFKYGKNAGEANVVFAEKGDQKLLGVTTLEALGLALNPIQREIVPLTLRA